MTGSLVFPAGALDQLLGALRGRGFRLVGPVVKDSAIGYDDITAAADLPVGGAHRDPQYARRREGAFIVAVNCGDPAGTCFCTSMGGGPRAESEFDLALTELDGDAGPENPEDAAHRFLWLLQPHRGEFDGRAVGRVLAFQMDGACLRDECERDPVLGYELMRRFSALAVARLQATRLQLLDVYGHATSR